MKVLYFGTVCNLTNYENLWMERNAKPSIAPIVFETSLLSGFSKNEIDVEVYSFPMIPSFPKTKLLFWGNKKEKLSCGYECIWLKTINIPIIKQITRKINGRYYLKKWLKENQHEECAVVSYSIPPFLVNDIIKYCKKYNVKCFAIVTDLLRDMYLNSKNNKIIAKLKSIYLSRAIKLQGCYDGYIYLTKEMSKIVNPQKPYIVVEGIADNNENEVTTYTTKAFPPAIMYAGMLEENYGVFNLIDAFESAELGHTELWLFGTGNSVDAIIDRSKKNSRIIYGGRKKREEILELEKKASLLVNPRCVDDEFTKYSFPSKTIEYMLSETPVLTTRLEGIPEEYYEVLFSCKNNGCMLLKESLQFIMSLSEEERVLMGKRGRQFIVKNKNKEIQAKRIYDFMLEVINSDY